VSTAEHPDALARRIEQLAAALPEGTAEAPREAELVEGLRAEMGALRAELGAVRAQSGAQVQRSDVGLDDLRGALEGRLALLEDALDGLSERIEALARDGASTTTSMLSGLDATIRRLPAVLAARDEELLASLRSDREQAARDRETTQELALAVRSTLDALSSALVDEDARAARQRAALDAGLDRVRTQVTTELAGVRRDLAAQLATQTAAQTTALGMRLEALTSAASATGTALQELRSDLLTSVGELREQVATTSAGTTSATAELQTLTAASETLRRDLDELGAGMVSATSELVAELRARSAREAEHLRTSLDAVRTGFDARAEELTTALTRGLLDIAEEVDVATTTTRDAASRVTVLTELTEAQRVGVEALLREVRADVVDAGQGLREELLTRTSSLLGELGGRLDDVEQRLSGVDGAVAGGAAASERVAASLDALTSTAERLDAAVDGFRAEWPTRTYEVVEGAKAVAEGVVLDVRAEVGARLDDVRATLERVVGTVDLARTGLHDGTDRLAQAGAVLVAYLEHRDRLLEAERDRVLHEVLDAFAAGLSARERSALAGRVTDAVARRRDARDAERYRDALGAPVSPTASLPDDVRTLGERAPERPPAPPPEPVVWPDREPEQPPVPVRAAEPVAVPPAPVRAASAPPVRVAARPPAARRTTAGSGGTVVVPGPGRSAQPAARRGSRTVAAPGRGRLGAMPEAPSVDVALDAAASRDDDRP
jgi:hypothetical protein